MPQFREGMDASAAPWVSPFSQPVMSPLQSVFESVLKFEFIYCCMDKLLHAQCIYNL
jgi:hypothetical protein